MANDLILVESATRRNEVMEGVAGDEKALEAINKAKALTMAMWQGQAVATSEQMAEFYGVPVDTVLSALKSSRSEFESDGLQIVKGEELKDLKYQLAKGASNDDAPLWRAKSAVAWTPRSALRLGMMLRDSEVAKQVRSLLLDVAQSANPAQKPAPVKPEPANLSIQETMAIIGEMSSWLPSRNIDEVMAAQWKFQAAANLCPQMKAIASASVAMIRNANPLAGGMAPMNATEVASAINDRTGIRLTARDINQAAVKLGLLTQRICNGKKEWDLTEEGLKVGKQYPVTAAATGWSGSQVRWSEAALDKFENYFDGEDLISGWEEAQ